MQGIELRFVPHAALALALGLVGRSRSPTPVVGSGGSRQLDACP